MFFGVASSFCAAAVAAQTTVEVPNGISGPQSGPVANDTSLAEIIVTATRRSESIQNVPGQVTALTSDALEQINARDFNDFAGFVRGLSYSCTVLSSNLLVIRGI